MSTSIARARKRIRKAFTLIEIMVSMVVMVIVILFVLQLTSSVLSSWNTGISAISSNTEARLALELMSRDLESSVIKTSPPGIIWLEVLADADTSAGSIDDAPVYEAAWLRFLTTSAAERDNSVNPGDLTAISYRLSWKWQLQGADPSTATQNYKTYGLHRTLVDPLTTFNDFLDYDATNATAPTTNIADWNALNTRDPNNLIASNVISFVVTMHWYDSAASEYGRTTIGPDTSALTGYANDATNRSYIADVAWVVSPDSNYTAIAGSDTNALYDDNAGNSASQITAIEVTLSILSDEGVLLMNRIVENKLTVASATNGGNWNDFLVRYSRAYSRKVNVSSTNL